MWVPAGLSFERGQSCDSTQSNFALRYETSHRPRCRHQRTRSVRRARAICGCDRLLDARPRVGRKPGKISADRPLSTAHRLPVVIETGVLFHLHQSSLDTRTGLIKAWFPSRGLKPGCFVVTSGTAGSHALPKTIRALPKTIYETGKFSDSKIYGREYGINLAGEITVSALSAE